MRIVLEASRGELRELIRRLDAGERVELVLAPPMTLAPGALSPLVQALRARGWPEREAQVAELDYHGCTLAEIARRLILSEHTIGWYWGRIYKRLGTSSRAEVRRVVTEVLDSL